jgi:hypothetical protein
VGVVEEAVEDFASRGLVNVDADSPLPAPEIAVHCWKVGEVRACNLEDISAVCCECFPRERGRNDAGEFQDAQAAEGFISVE